MLHAFIATNRDELVTRCRAKISSRPEPRATDAEFEYGVPLFLDQLIASLLLALKEIPETNPAIGVSGTKHGQELLRRGFTVA